MSNETVVFPDSGIVTIEDRERPEPGAGEVVIETSRTLVSTGTELTILSGKYPDDSHWDEYATYPFVPGYTNVGQVVEIGADVDEFEVGQRVANRGPHAQYVAQSTDRCLPVPETVSDEEAVFFGIAFIAMNGVRRSDLVWGESAAVYGLGLVGQLAIRVCHVAGARPVLGLDIAQDRLDYLPDESGIQGIDPTATDPVEVFEDVSSGRLADVVFEVTGNPDVIPQELDLLREQGRFVILSSPKGTTEFDFHDHCNAPSYEIIGAHSSSHPKTETIGTPWTRLRHGELFFEYLADGRITIDDLVSRRIHYVDAPQEYESLLANSTDEMGVVIDW